ncbi:MAG: glucosyl transferase, partial [Bacteroidetes bacterium]|nr:glucosyl transferase [Bacteroidota bacterium]
FEAFVHFDGERFESLTIPDILIGWGINAMWGTSSKDFYVVGNNGNIAHYNGISWSKITTPPLVGEDGVPQDIYDIWGDYNNTTGEYEILAVASKIFYTSERSIIKINKSGAEILDDTGINQPLRSVWFKSKRKYICTGSGRYYKNNLNESNWYTNWKSITHYFTNRIRGYETNDILMCGAFGAVLHYNGISWRSYLEKELPLINGELLGISVKENMVVLVGQHDRSGIIYLGRR